MGLADQAIQDFKRFSSNTDEFGIAITLTAPDNTVLVVNGYETLHHTTFDEFGVRINTRVASVAISLELLNDASYPYIIDDEADFNEHRVTVKGNDYIVGEFYPDITLNLVVLILSAWQA